MHKLEVGVVGCGIAGLSVAIALSRAGHTVEVFERSQFSNETGAAIIVGPNGTRILRRWGFDFEAAGALDYTQMRRFKADTIELDSVVSFDNISDKYGDRWLMLHRVDLHSGLKRLAEAHLSTTIRLGAAVEDVDPERGLITLASGETVSKDLVVIADGCHSKLIQRITSVDSPIVRLPLSMYRFLQLNASVMERPEAAQFYRDQPPGFCTFYKTVVGKPGHLLNTYQCRGGELLYCALLHPTKPKEKELEGWSNPAEYDDVIADAEGFHPAVKEIVSGATDVRVYNQMYRNPLPTFVKGRAVLVGDSGHFMLPTHGQGASMAIEDASALEVLFAGVSQAAIESRLQLFNKLRLPRARAVQSMSNKLMGPPDKMIAEVRQFYDGPIPPPGSKTFSPEFNDFFFLYDVEEEAQKLLRSTT